MGSMSYKAKCITMLALVLWASAFVGIRAGLHDYSPEGLALLRYIVASGCMFFVYLFLGNRPKIKFKDRILMLLLGAIGIGFYNLTLNYGELSISSGTASFIISQSPIIIALTAMLFLGERLTLTSLIGFLISIIGVFFIAAGETSGLKWDTGFLYIFLATFAGSFFTVLQKPFLKKYHAIEATAYVVWGGTLFLLFYAPKLQHDVVHASLSSTLAVIYLGIFPAAVGYVAWSYVLSLVPASRAGSFLYFTPFIATMLGWICLGETPAWLTLIGGALAIAGVWFVNQSYKQRTVPPVYPVTKAA